ncbi:MAG: patatin-like phospholipase family protein [Longimicrobiales bacterium]
MGLALSGGGAKGFAHIGVLRFLEQQGIPVHVVSGTSAGAIVGGLYALGVSVDSLEALAGGLDWDALFADRVERDRLSIDKRLFDDRTVFSVPLEGRSVRLPSGAVEGATILRLLDRLTWPAAAVRDFRLLPRPFAAVATDLETGEAVPLTEGVLSHALRASMGLPGLLEPFRIGARVLVDGGVARNLPAQDARALGADVVICSDVSDPLGRADQMESILDVLMQTMSFRMETSTLEQRGLCDVLIRPDIDGLSSTSFDQSGEWIARGQAAAAAQSAALDVLVGTTATAPTVLERSAGLLADSVVVDQVHLVGIGDPSVGRMVHEVLGLEPGAVLTPDVMDAAVGNLYATDLFQSVRYVVHEAAGVVGVSVEAQPRTSDRVGLGFRYDDLRRSSLLLAATLHHRLGYASTVRLDARLGEETQLRATYLNGRGATRRLRQGGGVSWTQAPLDLYEGGQRTARGNVRVAAATAVVGVGVTRSALLALELRGERAQGSTSIAPTDTSQAQWLGSVAAVIHRDSYDRPDLPREGGWLYARSEVGISSVSPQGSFVAHVVTGRRLIPLDDRLSVDLAFFAGLGLGSDLPFYRQFFVGGVHPSAVFPETQPAFFGLRNQEAGGSAAQILRMGLQWEVRQDRFLTLMANGGGAGRTWGAVSSDYRFGWAVSAGAPTMVGPIALTLSGGSDAGRTRLSFSLGREF